ncbi:MAG: hypothetical protein ACF8XB_08115 [Planctomycetota bacterium JB042]
MPTSRPFARPLAGAACLLLLAGVAAGQAVVTFEGAPSGVTTGLEYVAQGVVLSGPAGVQEFDYGGAVTEVVTSGDWYSPLEFKFVVPGNASEAAVTTSVSLRNHFGPTGPGSGTDQWTATSYDQVGAVIETKQLVGAGVLSFDQGAIHRVVLDDVNGTAFAADDLTFEAPTACGGSYGVGCPGTGGFVPTMLALGCGGSTLSLTIDGGLGGAASFLLLGTSAAELPMGGSCSLLVFPPIGPIGPLPLGGAGAGNGTTTLIVPMPTVSAPVTVHVQAFVTDTGGGMPFSNTAGLALQFAP